MTASFDFEVDRNSQYESSCPCRLCAKSRVSLPVLLTRTAGEATERMDAVCKALREMADMEIHMGKTKLLQPIGS